MDLDLNQEPLDQSYDSVIGLDTILNDLESAHGRIEERIRQLEAVTTRATRRQRWRNAPSVTEPAETAVADAHLERHGTGNDSAAQERIVHAGKTSKKDGSCLVAQALGMGTEPKTTGNKLGSFYDCNICLDVAKDPILTCCGHLFCWSCFYQLSYVHSNIKECPECQGEVTDTSIIPIYGHGNGNRAQKSKLNDSGLKVPPRPRAQRIESMRQQILFRATSSTLIEERIQQISNMIGTMGEQSRSQNVDATRGRVERLLMSRRRRGSQVLPVTDNERNQQNRSLQVSRLLLQGAQKSTMSLKYFLALLLAVVLLTTTHALKNPSDSNQEVIPVSDQKLPTTTMTMTETEPELEDDKPNFYKKKPRHPKYPPYKKRPSYKKHPPYKKYPPSSN